MASVQLSVSCEGALDPIARCSDCDEFDDSITYNLMQQVLDGAMVTDGVNAPVSLRQWLAAPHDRKADLKDHESQTVLATAIGMDGQATIDSQNCAFLFALLNETTCMESPLDYEFDLCITDVTLQPNPRTAMCFDTIRVEQFAALNPPSLTVPPLIAPERFLCEPPQDQVTTLLEGQTCYKVYPLGEGYDVTVTFQCTAPVGLIATVDAESGTCRDCLGATVSCNSDDVACKRYERTWQASYARCGVDSATQLIDVVMSGPCFVCPPDVCDLMTSGDPQFPLIGQGLADEFFIQEQAQNGTLTNGCGVPLAVGQITVHFRDEVLCARCCRGEISVDRIWTVTDRVCNKTSSCTQHLRVHNPCWEQYFPLRREQQCPCADR